jgi:hypothetical protein
MPMTRGFAKTEYDSRQLTTVDVLIIFELLFIIIS